MHIRERTVGSSVAEPADDETFSADDSELGGIEEFDVFLGWK
jgi:hypothetical protein